jgi:flavin-dependent dehydrogenase
MTIQTNSEFDVVILGGGLAGLTLSIQLKQKFADLKILVLERRSHPVPHAAHKVGESSVEIGAHYFEEVLGLKEHLQTKQLKKFGFRFFFSDGASDITQVTELGASKVLPTPSYQIDRGLFENSLAEIAQEKGVQFVDSAMVRQISLGEENRVKDEPHSITFDHAGERLTVHSRWLVDACGRAGIIKKKLKLEQSNGHNANAVWFRISDKIDVNQWSEDQAWLDRWLSTNHLCGEGYWSWLIPLASGSHSVGIVCDAELHPIETMNNFDKAMVWFEKHQPQLFKELDGKRDKLQDFAFFKRFSYGCKKVFSGSERWALTGEAGLFLDPFYSPGSDFIAISNTYITELIAQDRAKGPVDLYAGIFESIYFQLYENMLTLYEGQYKLFGDPEVMPVKVIWDYTYYWGVMCQLFIQNQLTDIITMSRMRAELANVQTINKEMQLFLRRWGEVSKRNNPAQMLDQASLPWFAELNGGLRDNLSVEAFHLRIKTNLAQLTKLGVEIVAFATEHYPSSHYPTLDATELSKLLGITAETCLKEQAKARMLFDHAA